jgi:hypothetical protein
MPNRSVLSPRLDREIYVPVLDDEGSIAPSLQDLPRRETDLLGPDGRRLVAVRARRAIGFGAAWREQPTTPKTA